MSLPQGATTVVMSPEHPTGTITTVQETVRLSRQSSLVVIDQRHAAYSPPSLLPFVREFEKLALLQTFETFAALTAFPLAWAVAPPRIAAEINAYARPSGIAEASLVAGLAAMEAESDITATVRQATAREGRLFRQLRKLSMISPPYQRCRISCSPGSNAAPPISLSPGWQLAASTCTASITLAWRITSASARSHWRATCNALKHALIQIALDL